MSKKMMDMLVEIKVDTAETKQHMKDMNSKVQRNVDSIELNRTKIEGQGKKIAYGGGIVATVMALFGIFK